MTTINPSPPSNLTQRAQVVAIANRHRLLNREQEERVITKAVRNVLKDIK